LDALAAHYRQLELWAEHCPENFEDRAALVGAEIARIEGRDLEAMHLYEKASQAARRNGFVHNEGIANEVAARFYGAGGFEQIRDLYLRNARDCYLRWEPMARCGSSSSCMRIFARSRCFRIRLPRSRRPSTGWSSPQPSERRRPCLARSSSRTSSKRSWCSRSSRQVRSVAC